MTGFSKRYASGGTAPDRDIGGEGKRLLRMGYFSFRDARASAIVGGTCHMRPRDVTSRVTLLLCASRAIERLGRTLDGAMYFRVSQLSFGTR
ncbi:hypothetical protein [Hyphomicrobium sp.]|uniref:hypothetical protein n=1 Tax=Hyphomicrobium sp. TaxID=82 RepID=UPI0025C5FFB4|nr:hypothetical protein [Hyphomicrobium sp.]MCC7250792.1 hypothetical protein [Hyphomicrobium sp.]